MKKKLIVTFALLSIVSLTACNKTEKYDLEFIKNKYELHQLDFRMTNMTKPLDLCNILVDTGMQADVKTIFFDNNNMKSTEVDLSCLTNLEYISFAFNSIEKIEGLKLPESTKTLDFSNNKITELGNLENMGNIEDLNLGFNKIKSVDSIKDLTNLKVLSLFHNQIEDISSLKNLTGLEQIKLEFNNISDISVLENMKNLNRITVKNNKLPTELVDKYTTFTQNNHRVETETE